MLSEKNKISLDMNIMQIVTMMSEGNPGALAIVMSRFETPEGLLQLLTCDSKGIRGANIYLLFNDCCGRDEIKFERTIKMIRNAVFTEEELIKNFELGNKTRSIPFLDDSIELVDENNPDEWSKYCELTKASFVKRLEEKLEIQRQREEEWKSQTQTDDENGYQKRK